MLLFEFGIRTDSIDDVFVTVDSPCELNEDAFEDLFSEIYSVVEMFSEDCSERNFRVERVDCILNETGTSLKTNYRAVNKDTGETEYGENLTDVQIKFIEQSETP